MGKPKKTIKSSKAMATAMAGLQRRPAIHDPRARFTIVAEGSVTEVEYFDFLADHFREALVDIKVVGGKGSPRQIVDESIRLRDAVTAAAAKGHATIADSDQYWALFDRDDFPQYLEAINFGRAARISVGYSNPCFELWLLLHYADYDRPCKSADLYREVQKHCRTYSQKNKRVPVADIFPNVALAIRRAERQLQARVEERKEFEAPSTSVGKLVAAIVAAGRPANVQRARR